MHHTTYWGINMDTPKTPTWVAYWPLLFCFQKGFLKENRLVSFCSGFVKENMLDFKRRFLGTVTKETEPIDSFSFVSLNAVLREGALTTFPLKSFLKRQLGNCKSGKWEQ